MWWKGGVACVLSMTKEHFISRTGLEALKAELARLLTERRNLSERIKEAREYGDLSENTEYIEAKTEQSFLEGRIEEIQNLLKNATVIDEGTRSRSVVTVGSLVKLQVNGKAVEYAIVGSNEADPASGKISNESPLGRALLGRRRGEMFIFEAPDGKRKYWVLEIK